MAKNAIRPILVYGKGVDTGWKKRMQGHVS